MHETKCNLSVLWQRPVASDSDIQVLKYPKYTMASCSSTHGHISSKWYVLMFGECQWLL